MRIASCLSSLVLLALVACEQTTPPLAAMKSDSAAEPAEDATPREEAIPRPAAKAPAKKGERAAPERAPRATQAADRRPVGERRAVGDAPPAPAQDDEEAARDMLRAALQPPDINARVNMNVDGQKSIRTSVRGSGMDVDMAVAIEDGEELEEEPAPRPRRGATTCKGALLAAGHDPVQLLHCEGAEPRCAVALLEAGHSPEQLVHCHDVEDVTCAVQVLRAGKHPSSIVHCD